MSSTEIVSWLVTAMVVVILVSFVLYAIGLRALPTDKRPTTPVYDRLGREAGVVENPDFRVNPGEQGKQPEEG